MLVHERIEQNEKELELPEIKILVVGDNFVGKTSVIQRFVNDTFCTEYNPTKEVEITRLNVYLLLLYRKINLIFFIMLLISRIKYNNY